METAFPDWASFTPESAAASLPRLLADAEKAVAAIESRAAVLTYEEYVWGLADATRDLMARWSMLSHMLGVMNSDAWRKVEEDFQPLLVAFSLRTSQSRPLYETAKRLAASENDPVRRRILDKAVEGAELSGVGLDGEARTRFNEIQTRLTRLAFDFDNAVIDATAAFKLEKDGETYTIDDANYPETMKHCADREVREKLYRARVARAPENEARIAEILALRAEEARLLGFPDYATLSVSQKCAPSVTAVFKMIDDLDAATVVPAEREAAELGPGIEPWDLTFAAERLRERKYAYSEGDLKRFLEAEDVMRGLFRMTRFLFGVDVEEIVGADKPSVWHPDVRFFVVKENGVPIAHFYADPYVRNGLKRGGAWMNEFRNRRKSVRPLAVIVMNFPKRNADGRCLLPMREVETLFHEFGHALQCMLTRVEEENAAGINLVEWDAVEVASQFMENWCLDDRTGVVVPPELKAKVRAAKNFRAASACRRQLAFAKTDLLLHSNHEPQAANREPRATKTEVFARFGLPLIPEDRFLCAFTHIFGGGYAAGYYSYKWAEVMSADCYGAFEEAGLSDDDAVRRLGARYRETVLALGGSKSALDVFREFRGRDPEINSMVRQQDLV